VHFALSAVPAGCRVTDTTLRLNASAAATGRTLQAIRLAAPWTEGGVKWSNQPRTTTYSGHDELRKRLAAVDGHRPGERDVFRCQPRIPCP
jgi:hypothetical protein